MVLNYIWVGFVIISFIVALAKLIFLGDTQVFSTIVTGTFSSAKLGFEVALGLTGALTMWMGIMRVGEKAGAIRFLSKIIGPFFKKLFPDIPQDHPAIGNIMMNFSANMLGIGNAATPLGLKAMASMQEINPDKTTASNSQIMFLVLNTAGFTLIPVTIMALRATKGAHDPTDVFIPILISTYCASLIGLILVAIRQGINLFDKVLLSWLIGGTVFISGVIYLFLHLSPTLKGQVASVTGNSLILGIIVAFIVAGVIKKQNVYDSFIEGAKEGFSTAIKIIPYLVGILIAVGMFRSCGAMDYLIQGIAWCVAEVGLDTRFVPSIPVAIMKPLSGGGTQGITVELMASYGVDSFVGRLSSVMYASADTTLYIVALYFGSVGITKTRYAIGAGLLADLAGILAAIFVSYLFWG